MSQIKKEDLVKLGFTPIRERYLFIRLNDSVDLIAEWPKKKEEPEFRIDATSQAGHCIDIHFNIDKIEQVKTLITIFKSTN